MAFHQNQLLYNNCKESFRRTDFSSSYLSYVLGIGSQIDFLEGETISSPEQAKESRRSDSLINEEDLPITLVKITTKPIEILEPESFEVDVLIEAIVTTMDKNGYYVDMAVSPDDYLTVTPIFNPYQFSFRLPAVINKALGFSESFVFTGPEQILLDSKKQEETTTIKPKSEKKRDQLKSATSCQIIVETSIVEESNFGPYAQKILKLFRRSEGKRTVHHIDFYPIEYRKINVTELNLITVTLKDTNFNTITETVYPTTVTLHIKRFSLI
jgi:hypothetical protein